MGWSSGSGIYDVIAKQMEKEFGERKVQQQARILGKLIDILEDGDCDTLDECQGISVASDLALKEAGYHICDNPEDDVDGWKCPTCGYKY